MKNNSYWVLRHTPSLREANAPPEGILAGCWPAHYGLLDGLRGLAALAVVIHHLGFGRACNLGYYAVLVFFVISGYCIAAAVDSGMTRGVPLKRFILRRVRRIYPPYICAFLFFVGTRLVKAARKGDLQLPTSLGVWLQNVTLTQWVSLLRTPLPWPADNKTLAVAAFWSLNYEEQFYLVMGLLMVFALRARWQIGSMVLTLGAVAVLWGLATRGQCRGLFIEYWVPFALGAVVFMRLCRSKTARQRRLLDVGLVLAVAVSAILCIRDGVWGPSDARNLYLEWLVAGCCALMLVVARPVSAAITGHVVGRALVALGAITYSLYLTHQFNLHAVRMATSALLPVEWRPGLHVLLESIMLLLVATVFWYFCERPFLNTRNARTR